MEATRKQTTAMQQREGRRLAQGKIGARQIADNLDYNGKEEFDGKGTEMNCICSFEDLALTCSSSLESRYRSSPPSLGWIRPFDAMR